MSASQPVRAAFVSDIHLIDSTVPNWAPFLRFLDQIKQQKFTHLFMLGDVFDIWVADHEYFRKRFAEILAKLKELKQAGIEIHYFEGNHDLDLFPYFKDELDLIVHEDALLTTLAGKTLRLEHGDQMDPDDRDYLFLRWLLRTPIVRWLGRHLPGKIVSWIGETASRTSRNYTTKVRSALSHEQVEHKIITHARKVHKKQPFDLLVAGHVHVLVDQQIDEARIVNLGTWLEKPLYLELTPAGSKFHFL